MTSPHKKVLLVDDEPKLISALRRRLALEFDIVTASGGPEALEIIDKDPEIAVIVADMQMPIMTGIELLKAVKARAPQIRRLMLTGNADQETAVAAVNEGGVMRFLRKPCDNDDLKAALRHALEEFAFQNKSDNAALPPLAADSSAKARDAFLSMMNHELRTPLNHIIGFAHVLEQQNGLASQDDSVEFLKHIRDSGEQVLNVVNRIIEYSRLRSGDADREHQTADIIAIVNAEAEKARKTAKLRNITIAVDSLRLKADILANPDEAALAIRELLSNAVKFNIDGGHVSIAVKCDPEKTAVRISDTGVGAPKDLAEKLGRPFVQGEDGLSRRHDGVGLGLALVSSIAEANAASFSVDDGPAGGFTATLVFRRPRAEMLHAVA